jgi:hypothetical protein
VWLANVSKQSGGRADEPQTSAEVLEAVRQRVKDAGSWELRCSTRLRDLESFLAEVLDLLRDDQRRWILIIEPTTSPSRYVQVIASSDARLFAECVSNEFLARDERLTIEQDELLPVLGWDWPAPPAKPNWSFHDELLNTGHAIGMLLIKTISQVFACTDDDILTLKVFPSSHQD